MSCYLKMYIKLVSEHSLNNLKTIESNLHMIIVTRIYLGQVWAG